LNFFSYELTPPIESDKKPRSPQLLFSDGVSYQHSTPHIIEEARLQETEQNTRDNFEKKRSTAWSKCHLAAKSTARRTINIRPSQRTKNGLWNTLRKTASQR